MEYANGDVYDGEWRNDLFYGGDVYTCRLGDVHERKLKNREGLMDEIYRYMEHY